LHRSDQNQERCILQPNGLVGIDRSLTNIQILIPINTVTENSVSFEFSQKLVGVQKNLYAFILSLLPNRSDAEDVLQETNLILCQKSKEYDPEGNFRSWAFNIARFQVLGHLTKKKRSKVYFSNELVETLASEEFDARTHQLTQRALQICYELLPDHMREISRLRFKEDLSMKEISKRIQRPIGAISGTLFRIRQNLVQCVRIKLPQLEAESEL
jgi:RNA polymerase sigma-70 factor (ECF subfamily)